jgi:hypothetical protein
MREWFPISGRFLVVVLVLGGVIGDARADTRVTVLRTPEGGIQPQAVASGDGTIHLIFFKGDSYKGDLFYATAGPGRDGFGQPVRINSQGGTAIAVGSIRGGQLALGKANRIHVAWNGNAAPSKNQGHDGAPMYYTRSNVERTAFEPQRDLMTRTSALDGGGTVAADELGNVCVAWHGRGADAVEGEQGRRLWIARSRDEGKTFTPEEPAVETETGACGCCGTRALADRRGGYYILYRTAAQGVERDMYLLSAPSISGPFRGRSLGPWKTRECPMSSESLFDAGTAVLAAWETRGQVQFVRIDPHDASISQRITPPGPAGDRKHPAVAANDRGDVLLVWAEGTGWQKGGALVWQIFDREGQPTAEKGRIRNGVPIWGLTTAVATAKGFTIIH